MMKLSIPAKTSIIGVGVGVSLILVLAAYFRRRGRRKAFRNLESVVEKDEVDSAYVQKRARKTQEVKTQSQKSTHANGEIVSVRRSTTPTLSECNSFSSCKDDDTLSDSTHTILDPENLTPNQLCDAGLEALQTAISHWEDALNKIEDMDGIEMQEHTELKTQLTQLLARGYGLQDSFQRRLFRQVSATVALDAALEEMDREYAARTAAARGAGGEYGERLSVGAAGREQAAATGTERRHYSLSSVKSDMSSTESFVSALDMADLSDLETELESASVQDRILYEAALLELQHGTIPCRVLRTKMVNCPNDTEFLAKLHCVRMGFQEMLKNEGNRNWFIQAGRDLLSDLLIQAEKDPEDFQEAFDDMIEYAKQEENWPEIEEELRLRGVKMMTFYDMVIDFILFDAFDDLESPPSSVISVTQNRWLSNSFKETALSTAVWSVLKAKRRLLRFPKGFISHFYAISEHVSPVLAWGFLGPEGPLRTLCYYFRDQVLSYMEEVFSFDSVRYTTVEQMSDDLLKLTRKHIEIAAVRLSSS